MKNLIIIGAGGHGLVVAEIAQLNKYKFMFWDDNPKSKSFFGIKPFLRQLEVPQNHSVIIAIGNNKVRQEISTQYNQRCFESIIHSRAILSPYCVIGLGSVVMAGVIINPGAKIGSHCIINTSSVIEHEALIGDFVHISPNATILGNAKIGKSSWVGAGAIVLPGVNIGENCIIGAGSIVLNDIPMNSKAVGNPARIINE